MNTVITLDAYYAAVTAAIRAQFTGFKTVEFDREDRESLPLPACLLTISEFEDAAVSDPQTEQWATLAKVEAQVILGFRTPAVQLAVRKAATALAVWLRLKRFPDLDNPGKALPTGPAMVQGCYKDDFDPEQDKYDIWRVEWMQQMDLGESVWFETGTTPDQPVFSWAPAIGTGNADKYEPAIRGGFTA